MSFDATNLEFSGTDELITPVVKRTLTGRGQQHGGLQTIFTNPSSTVSMRVVFLESLPWFTKPYFHTLRTQLSVNGSQRFSDCDSAIFEMFYRPAVDRKRASHLEITLDIPTASTLMLSYEFEKTILRYTEYPPDANRGFDIAPAIIRVIPTTVLTHDLSSDPSPVYIRTTSLLLYLPTPGMIMIPWLEYE